MNSTVVAAIGLGELRPGEWAEVQSLTGSDHELSRLASLGLRAGARIQMLRTGRTCIVELDDSRICVRTSPRTRILVQPV